MSVCNVQIPETKFSLIEWRKPNERPKENDRVLIVDGRDVLAARYIHGDFFVSGWRLVKNPFAWTEWPKAPVW